MSNKKSLADQLAASRTLKQNRTVKTREERLASVNSLEIKEQSGVPLEVDTAPQAPEPQEPAPSAPTPPLEPVAAPSATPAPAKKAATPPAPAPKEENLMSMEVKVFFTKEEHKRLRGAAGLSGTDMRTFTRESTLAAINETYRKMLEGM